MSGFSIEWLNLREASDHKARDRHLLKTVANWLNDLKSKDKVIVEIGTGFSLAYWTEKFGEAIGYENDDEWIKTTTMNEWKSFLAFLYYYYLFILIFC